MTPNTPEKERKMVGNETERDLAIIERVLNACVGLGHGTDWNNGTHAKKYGYRKQLLDALLPALEAMARLQARTPPPLSAPADDEVVEALKGHVQSLIGLIEANAMPLTKDEYRYVQDARAALAKVKSE